MKVTEEFPLSPNKHFSTPLPLSWPFSSIPSSMFPLTELSLPLNSLHCTLIFYPSTYHLLFHLPSILDIIFIHLIIIIHLVRFLLIHQTPFSIFHFCTTPWLPNSTFNYPLSIQSTLSLSYSFFSTLSSSINN